MQCKICPKKGRTTDRVQQCGLLRRKQQHKSCSCFPSYVGRTLYKRYGRLGYSFLFGCNLKCVYCQNESISRGKIGYSLNEKQLSELFLIINDSGVHNINLVTPTHYMPMIIKSLEAVKHKLNIPVVYNCSGYEGINMIDRSQGIIDIFLTDIKYFSNQLAEKYSFCTNYFEVAAECLQQMIKITGKPVILNELMKSGVIVRHMVLPSHKNDSIDILNELYKRFGNTDYLVSLMNQYTPMPAVKDYPEINRKLTALEYKRVVDVYESLGFNGYVQGKQSASQSYIPDFSEKGEFLLHLIG